MKEKPSYLCFIVDNFSHSEKQSSRLNPHTFFTQLQHLPPPILQPVLSLPSSSHSSPTRPWHAYQFLWNSPGHTSSINRNFPLKYITTNHYHTQNIDLLSVRIYLFWKVWKAWKVKAMKVIYHQQTPLLFRCEYAKSSGLSSLLLITMLVRVTFVAV